jgi:hypothetical protein
MCAAVHLYWYRGIYVHDHRVIEFGGGNTVEMREAVLRDVSIEDFERGV